MSGDAPTSIADILARKMPVTVKVPIVLDPDLAEQHARLKNEAELARIVLDAQSDDGFRSERVAQYEQALVDFEEFESELRSSGAVVDFVFRSIGREAYDALVSAHQPSSSHHERVRRETGNPKAQAKWNTDTFPVALLVAASHSPKLTEADVKALASDERWNDAEFSALLYGAIQANETRGVIDWGKGSPRT